MMIEVERGESGTIGLRGESIETEIIVEMRGGRVEVETERGGVGESETTEIETERERETIEARKGTEVETEGRGETGTETVIEIATEIDIAAVTMLAWEAGMAVTATGTEEIEKEVEGGMVGATGEGMEEEEVVEEGAEG